MDILTIVNCLILVANILILTLVVKLFTEYRKSEEIRNRSK